MELPERLVVTRFKADMQTRVDARLARVALAVQEKRAQDRLIDARDQRTCRACGRRTDPDAVGLLRGHRHHIVYRSAGGAGDPANVVTLCIRCHSDEHADRLRFTAEGGPYQGIDANAGMEFWRKDENGSFYLSRRELAPGVVEKD